jgi:hypothetical protein
LYLKHVPLVELWSNSGGRSLVIELPDKSHARIPAAWADDGESLAVVPSPEPKTLLSVATATELMEVLRQLERRGHTSQR